MTSRVLLGKNGGTVRLPVTVANVGGNKFHIDGATTPDLNLFTAVTYIFDQSDSSNSGHPFRFSQTVNGTHGGGSNMTYQVTVNGTPGSAGAYTQIAVQASGTPNTLYYYCSSHSGMGNSAKITKITGVKTGIRISKPGINVETAPEKNLLLNTEAGRSGQIYAGGTDASASGTELSSGFNFLTGTGSTKANLGYIPLVLTREDASGDDDVSSSSNDFTYIDNVSFFKTTSTHIRPTAMNVNISGLSSSQLTNGTWTALDGASRSQTKACTNLKFYVLRIPCAYGYMNSTYFG